MLRRSKKPVVLAVNKIDHPKYADALYDFYELGIGEPITISAEQGLGLGDVLDEVVAYFPEHSGDEYGEATRVAVVGKPNVGKSSLVNALLGDERTIVSNIPGTTRDAIDSPFTYNGKEYVLVDTAGIRRKRSIEDESIERYSVIRSLAAIRRCRRKRPTKNLSVPRRSSMAATALRFILWKTILMLLQKSWKNAISNTSTRSKSIPGGRESCAFMIRTGILSKSGRT